MRIFPVEVRYHRSFTHMFRLLTQGAQVCPLPATLYSGFMNPSPVHLQRKGCSGSHFSDLQWASHATFEGRSGMERLPFQSQAHTFAGCATQQLSLSPSPNRVVAVQQTRARDGERERVARCSEDTDQQSCHVPSSKSNSSHMC